ncbi:MAG: aldose epimerase family protein [Pseudomonadota bacterium]
MRSFGVTEEGRRVHAIEIGGDALSATILTYGAVLNDVRLAGVDRPLTLGSPDLAAYEGPLESFGALMGPVVNRIRDGRAVIAGRDYSFERNFEGRHTLHSGRTGSHRQVWEVEAQGPSSVSLRLDLPDGLGGFPGIRWVRAIYAIENAALSLEIAAESDAPTLFSFANHSYWALDGVGFGGQTLTVPAGRYLEAGRDLMPTGAVTHVEGTPYDARHGLALTGDESQFLDLNYCFCEGDRALHEVARLAGPSGLTMTMESTAPGLQVYDCGTIDGAGFATHHGPSYGRYAGLALEAQRWPGATTHAHFPKIAHDAGERFHQLTRWRFAR